MCSGTANVDLVGRSGKGGFIGVSNRADDDGLVIRWDAGEGKGGRGGSVGFRPAGGDESGSDAVADRLDGES